MKKNVYLLFIGISILFASCNNANEPVVQTNPELTHPGDKYTVEEKNAMIEDYAKLLATSLGNQSLRKVIKSEAELMFDGDYNVLVKKLQTVKVDNGTTDVRQLLLSNQNVGKMRSKFISENRLDSLVEKVQEAFPNLQISVPLYCEEWDAENYTPVVAFLPYDYDETTAAEITAFDINGNTQTLSLEKDPDKPVVVVSISERVDENEAFIYGEPYVADQKISKIIESYTVAEPSVPTGFTLSHGTRNSLILEWNDVDNETGYEIWRMANGAYDYTKIAETGKNINYYVNSGLGTGAKYFYKIRSKNAGGTSGYTPSMATTASGRNDNEVLRVARMYFTNSALKAVEKWASGAPEIRLRVVKGSESGANTVFSSGLMEPKRRRDIDGKWWEYSFDIFGWGTSVYGTVLTFDWREEDWNQKVKFSISGSYEAKAIGGEIKSGGSVEIPANPGGHHIGQTSVFWWDAKDKVYDINGFKWQFN